MNKKIILPVVVIIAVIILIIGAYWLGTKNSKNTNNSSTGQNLFDNASSQNDTSNNVDTSINETEEQSFKNLKFKLPNNNYKKANSKYEDIIQYNDDLTFAKSYTQLSIDFTTISIDSVHKSALDYARDTEDLQKYRLTDNLKQGTINNATWYSVSYVDLGVVTYEYFSQFENSIYKLMAMSFTTDENVSNTLKDDINKLIRTAHFE